MPWSLNVSSLLVVFVVLLVAGAGWTLGCWIMSFLMSLPKRN